MAFKMKGSSLYGKLNVNRTVDKSSTPPWKQNENGDPEKEPGTLENLGSKLDPYYEKVKKTVGKGVEAHRKGVDKLKDVVGGDLARMGMALGGSGTTALGITAQLGKEIYDKIKGKGEQKSTGKGTKKLQQVKFDPDKVKEAAKTGTKKLQQVKFTPPPTQELEKIKGKKPTTIPTEISDKPIVTKK